MQALIHLTIGHVWGENGDLQSLFPFFRLLLNDFDYIFRGRCDRERTEEKHYLIYG